MRKSVKRKLYWILFGVVSLGVKMGLGWAPEFTEKYYSRGFFIGIRWLYDTLFTWLPFPLIYLFFAVLFYVWIRRWRRKAENNRTWAQWLLHASLGTLAFFMGGIGLFFWVWGYNYSRMPIEAHLQLKVEPLTLEHLKKELELETQEIIHWRSQINGITDSSFTADLLPKNYEWQVRQLVESWLQENEYPTPGRVRGRELYPKGIFLHFSSSGLYFPFTAEGHVDAGVHPLQKPPIIAHELSHGYGFGDEGTCNFTAYLACSNSANPVIAYCGHLNYWRTLAVNYLRYKPKEYREFRSNLPIGIQEDLDAINDNLDAYPDLMPKFRYYAYDTYLKAQGIDEGIKNYNRVIMLVKAWRRQQKL